jgi:hypothetical protein
MTLIFAEAKATRQAKIAAFIILRSGIERCGRLRLFYFIFEWLRERGRAVGA